MDIHEYQGKALLARYGVAIPKGGFADTADQAVERAKEIGGAGYSFLAPGMDAKMQQRRVLELELRKAVALGQDELDEENVTASLGALLKYQEDVDRMKGGQVRQVMSRVSV